MLQAVTKLDFAGRTIPQIIPVSKKGPFTVTGTITCPTCNSQNCINQVDLLTYVAPVTEGNQKEKVLAGPIFVNGKKLLLDPYQTEFQINTTYLTDISKDFKVWVIGVLRSTTDPNCNYQVKVGSANFTFEEDADLINVGVIDLFPH